MALKFLPVKYRNQNPTPTVNGYSTVYWTRQMGCHFQEAFYISVLFLTFPLDAEKSPLWEMQLPKRETWRSSAETRHLNFLIWKIGTLLFLLLGICFSGMAEDRDSPMRGALSFLIISRSKFWEQKCLNYRGKVFDLWKWCLWNHNAHMTSTPRDFFPPIKTAWKLGLIGALTSIRIIDLVASVTCLDPRQPNHLSCLPQEYKKQRGGEAWQGWAAPGLPGTRGNGILHLPGAGGLSAVCGWPWAWNNVQQLLCLGEGHLGHTLDHPAHRQVVHGNQASGTPIPTKVVLNGKADF